MHIHIYRYTHTHIHICAYNNSAHVCIRYFTHCPHITTTKAGQCRDSVYLDNNRQIRSKVVSLPFSWLMKEMMEKKYEAIYFINN